MFRRPETRGREGRVLPARRVQVPRLRLVPILVLFSAAWVAWPEMSPAQVNYVARFTLEKEAFLLGEPIFCDFTLQNIGRRTVAFSYRLPDRVPNRDLEQEPHFVLSDEKGEPLADPAPKPCGGAKGSVVYGSATLPPGQTHSERWLLNQWARIATPGHYRVRARRRLPLFVLEAPTRGASERPAAYAMAINDLAFEVLPSTEAQLEAIFQPYLKSLDDAPGSSPDFIAAALVVTVLPQPFLLGKLESMACLPSQEKNWDRRQALEGLARLGTPPAWEVIAAMARGKGFADRPGRAGATDEPLRAYAILLLGEKADIAHLPTLLDLASTAPDELRGDVLRVLGSFHDTRSNQVLFERLHSASASDRVNAILGLKNLESRDAVPALMAMLNDHEAKVRQVADFALESLTGIKLKLSPNASRAEAARVATRWHAWWSAHGGNFAPIRQAACHDW
jgi:PBS lyase HEAT-like repeat-containing protein